MAVAKNLGDKNDNDLFLNFDQGDGGNAGDPVFLGTHLEDGDTGGGVKYVEGMFLMRPGSGGPVVIGVTGEPVIVQPSGSGTQPVSLPTGQAAKTGSTPVTLASDEDLLNNLAVDATEGSDPPTTGPLLRGKRQDAEGPTTATDLKVASLTINQWGYARMTGALMAYDGAADVWNPYRAPTTRKRMNSVAIGTAASVWAPAGGKTIRLLGGCFSLSAEGAVLFEDNAGGGTFIFDTGIIPANQAVWIDLGPEGHLLGAADNDVFATASVTANIRGTLYGVEE